MILVEGYYCFNLILVMARTTLRANGEKHENSQPYPAPSKPVGRWCHG